MNRLIEKVKGLFFRDEAKNIFGHKANGEPCCVCNGPMHTEQGITMVGSGEKMHSKCWSKFFEMRFNQIAERQRKINGQ